MSVSIPRQRIASVTLRPMLYSGEQEGAFGGESLPIPRMGDRWAADIETAQLRLDAPGRDLVAALTQALTDDGSISIDQPNRPANMIAADGLVDGSGSGGTSLTVRGLPAGMAIARGIYFSIVHAGRRYVHMTTAASVVSSAGKVALPIWPMLRFLTVDGEIVELAQPRIEGKLTGFSGAKWIRNRIDPLGLVISERA
ncbi:hypothetical protein [Sphingomonas sp. BK580]|uniref:hypothetical protein n=1 Tax=Sphingomonas sp. BK580 TaxID=2586972 RepID=UPI00161D1E35|nr:hypothetical protein [Sphingomonas sp. BK580]MBB3691450.1 hypothetical protein [Sphingomonas sp. BK580]